MTTSAPRAAAAVRPGGRLPHRSVWAVGVLAVLVVGYAALHGAFPFPSGLDIGLSPRLDAAYQWVVHNRDVSPLFLYGFNYISVGLGSLVTIVDNLLTAFTWPGVVAVGVVVAGRVAGWRMAVVTAVAFGLFGVLGLWDDSMTTLALMLSSVLIALIIGVPLGIVAGRVDRFQRIVTPILDFMQTMPSLAYLMPMVLLFGIGTPAASVATVVYAIPPAVRITALAIRGVPPAAVEATTSMGSTSSQLLFKVRLPLARRTILLAVNQTIMMAMSMVVVASIIGAGGLGDDIYQALSKVNVGTALQAGLAIVVLAVALDRVTNAAGRRTKASAPRTTWARYGLPGVGVVAAVAAIVVGRVALPDEAFPDSASVSIAAPVNDVVDWLQGHVGGATDAITRVLVDGVFDPLRAVLTDSPWWLVVAAVVALGAVLGGYRVAITSGVAVLLTGLLGVWSSSMDTLSQVIVASVLTIGIGGVIGVAAARSDVFAAIIRPILDAMQTMPAFVYLIPVVALFDAGRTPAAIAAVIYALPVVIRLVNDGVRGVSRTAVEAATALGSNRWQLLFKVQLPLARASLLVAMNQGIMMVLAMVAIGALVGAGALGYGVVFGLAQNQFGLGMCSGLAIVFLGTMLDRISQGAARAARH
ncbi:MAG TPA: ABC transporter permease subunit [Streptosporangiaceae bacterium]